MPVGKEYTKHSTLVNKNYIYNKFSLVNCMHYLQCSINITHTILVAAEDPWHLASLF